MKAEDLTREVWDYVFLAGPQPQHSAIPAQTLQALRREFEFWYPFDLRVGPPVSCGHPALSPTCQRSAVLRGGRS